jgi:hypothetical protein
MTITRIVTTIALAAIVVTPTAARAASRADDARRAASWLASKQNNSGTWGDGRASAVGEGLAAVVAGGVRGKPVTKALTYIRDHGEADATKAALTGQIVSGIVAAGGDPRNLGGVDYVAILDAQYDEASGRYDPDQLFPNLLGALGALAAHGDLPSRAVAHIEANQCDTGGFGFNYDCRGGADVDTTSLAINALVGAKAAAGAVDDARAYLLDVQRSSGGFSFVASDPVSADSTGLAMTAIAALDEEPHKAPWRQSDGDSPLSALRKLQHSSGAFVTGGKPNVRATVNATPGMAGLTYPIPPATERPPPLPSPTSKPASGDGGVSSGGATDDDPDDDADPTLTPRRRAGRGGGSADVASASGEPGERRERKSDGDDLEAGGSFDRPQAEEDTGLPGLLIGGLLVASAGAIGTGIWFLRFRR